ncbi:hypothetical protein KC324_g8193 [Hortaea werneckii]|nr:hypothetical protein KC324_g8193 [Hortaea werneckii]
MGSAQSYEPEPHKVSRASGRLARPTEEVFEQQARAGSKRPSSPLSTDFELKDQGHKRMKSASHVDDRGRVAKPTPPSSDPNADILKRASFLGFSMPITTGKDEAVPPVRRSNYFRLRAAGVPTEWDDNLRGTKRKLSESGRTSTLLPSIRASPQPKLAKSSDDQTLKMSALMKTTTAPPSFSSANGISQQPSAAGPVVNAAPGVSDDRDEDIISRVRRAREALARGADDFKKDMETEMKVRESMRSSTSSNDSPSLARARAEARLAASHGNSTSYSATRNVPAYRLRESRFVPKEQYGRAIERSKEMRASRSKEISRPTSRMEDSKQTFDFDSPSKKQESQFSTFDFANPSQKRSQHSAFKAQPQLQQTSFSHSQEIPESQSASVGFGTHSSQPAFDSKTQLEAKPNGFLASSFTGWQPPSTIETSSHTFFKPMAGQSSSEIQDSQPNHLQTSTETTKAQNPFSGFSAGSNFFSKPSFGSHANGAKSVFGTHNRAEPSTFGFGALPKSPSPVPTVHNSNLEPDQDDLFGTEGQPDSKTAIQHDFTIQPNHINDSLSTSFGGQKWQPYGLTEATDMFGRPRSQAHGLGQSTFSSFGQQSSPARAQEGFNVPTPEEVNLVSDEEEESQPPYASQFAQNLASAANGLHEQQDNFGESEEDEAEVQDSYQYSSNPYAALARDAGGDTEEDYDEKSEEGQGYDTEIQEPNGNGQPGADEEEQGGYDGEDEDLEDFDEEDEDEPFDDEETIGGPSSFGRQQFGNASESADGEEYDEDEDEDEDDEEIDPSTPVWNRAPSANPDLQGVGGTAEEAIELSD